MGTGGKVHPVNSAASVGEDAVDQACLFLTDSQT